MAVTTVTTQPNRSAERTTPEPAAEQRIYPKVMAGFALWSVLSPVLLGGVQAERLDDLVVGALLGAVAAYSWYRLRTDGTIHPEIPVLTALLGLWVVPFSLEFGAGRGLMVDSVLLGLAVCAWNSWFYNRVLAETRW